MPLSDDQIVHCKVRRFDKKPKELIPASGITDAALASMVIYGCNTEFRCDELFRDARDRESERDFGHSITPDAIARSRVYA